jgi:CheY-like chemotaxis protein
MGSGHPTGAPSILVLVRDLLFSSRIAETARRLGYPCRVARTVEDFRSRLGESPGLIMLDLTAQEMDHGAALSAVDAAGRPAPVLAWTTHALWKTTKPLHARCDRVVTREDLTGKLPELLTGYLEREAGARSGPGRGDAHGQ